MRSTSENSYGARIGNAEKLVTILHSFDDYHPQKPEYSANEFYDRITDLKTQNNNIASKKQSYSLAVETRKQLFEKSDNSIKKVLSPINATVKASFGREAKEATEIAGIIAKIRGANAKTKNTATTEEATISQSYRSFSSQTQFFADLLVNLTHFGNNYNPSNNNLSLSELNTLHSNATLANNQVMDTYAKFIKNNDDRISNYEQLSQIAIRIKDSVKSQYGNQSPEHILVKGLKI